MRGSSPLTWPQAVIVLALTAAFVALGIVHIVSGDVVAVTLTGLVGFVTGAGVVHNGMSGAVDEVYNRLRALEKLPPSAPPAPPVDHV